ncbi:PREDICTED: probable LRR receptor [Prunus dulcis]|uniref:non-specific serine/threonine protein kinase n=1 Tax=Prunus dulcis TaxID=3755 RepID=A0A5E4FBD4_PRUDU|nr:PREDICTED: probable LRR receptor [Prunus dulcis]
MHLRMGGNETDRLALLAIKAQIKQDPHNVLSAWNESIHFCSWHGVSCGRHHRQRQRVTKLNLQSQDLVGSLSPNIGNLSFLRELELQNNNFSSKIPPEIGNLRRLQVLSLHNNSFSGPIPYNISYCSNLIYMNFGFNGLVGNLSSLEPIPSSMIGLKALEELDLSHNNLWCEIPKFLERFVSLKKLDLSFNDFWGAVPTGGAFKNASVILITGNPMLCGRIANLQLPKCESPKGGSSRSLIIRLVLSGLALLGIAMEMYYFFLCSSRKKRKEIPLSTLPNSLVQVSYATLLKATDEFSSANRIGAGSFGSVYRGVLYDDGKAQLVAVKALVYEYMERGSLEEWLHPPTEIEEVREALNLEQRLDIAIDVACTLDYLHNHCETPIVHCDLKPSNVLLDNEMTGHVSDFGLARFLSQKTGTNASENQTSSIGIKGTVGYAAPEYGMGSEVSTNGEVYSFGILLLEMFVGKRPTDDMFNGDLNLRTFVKMAFPERVMEIADSTLFEGGINERRVRKIEVCLNSIFRIGIECSAESPTDRLKNISDAAPQLHFIRDVLLGTTKKLG